MSNQKFVLLTASSLLFLSLSAWGQGQCTSNNGVKKAYFGDLHVHSSYSFDSYILENRNDPYDAYEFARGEPLDLGGGVGRSQQLTNGPLDFAVVADHAEYLGEVNLCTERDSRNPAEYVVDLIAAQLPPTHGEILRSLCISYRDAQLVVDEPEDRRLPIDALRDLCRIDGQFCGLVNRYLSNAWANIIDAAEINYEACSFTTFPGYEWTQDKEHRNIIFNGAGMTNENGKPTILPISALDISSAPQIRFMVRSQCKDGIPGCDVISIPHNSNYSEGTMFDMAEGESFADRNEIEPLVEIYQHKSSSECLSYTSPDDPGCRFEKYYLREGESGQQTAKGMVRNALLKGMQLQYESPGAANPLQLGIVASSDTHNGTPGAVEEENFKGHLASLDAGNAALLRPEHSPGGLAGVWATENTRESLFAGLRNRETFGTSGPKIRVRMAAGWNLSPNPVEDSASLCQALIEERLVESTPMGGVLNLPGSLEDKVQLVIFASRDPNRDQLLERIQIVKGWVDSTGQQKAEIVKQVGAGDEGRRFFCVVYQDDQLDTTRPAFYYVRVLEKPSPRWSKLLCQQDSLYYQCTAGELTWEDDRQGEGGEDDPNKDTYAPCCDTDTYNIDIQERAWSSPIWFQSTDVTQ